MKRIYQFLRFQCRKADLRCVRTVYFLLSEFLGETPPPPEPCLLVLTVPPPDWQWLAERPPAFRERYQQGLTDFATQCQRQLGGLGHTTVVLRKGNGWKIFWEDLPPSAPPETPLEEEPVGGYFIAPDKGGALWVLWQHPFAPRVPTLQEQRADPCRLEGILTHLLPTSPDQPRWREGEARLVCGQEVLFYRCLKPPGEGLSGKEEMEVPRR